MIHSDVGSTSSAEAHYLTNITVSLLQCSQRISENCLYNFSTYNRTLVNKCEHEIKDLLNLAKKCQKKDVSKACNCWNDVKLKHLMSSTSRCKINRSAISEKKSKCQLVFMRCRELELASIKSFYECPGNI